MTPDSSPGDQGTVTPGAAVAVDAPGVAPKPHTQDTARGHDASGAQNSSDKNRKRFYL